MLWLALSDGAQQLLSEPSPETLLLVDGWCPPDLNTDVENCQPALGLRRTIQSDSGRVMWVDDPTLSPQSRHTMSVGAGVLAIRDDVHREAIIPNAYNDNTVDIIFCDDCQEQKAVAISALRLQCDADMPEASRKAEPEIKLQSAEITLAMVPFTYLTHQAFLDPLGFS